MQEVFKQQEHLHQSEPTRKLKTNISYIYIIVNDKSSVFSITSPLDPSEQTGGYQTT